MEIDRMAIKEHAKERISKHIWILFALFFIVQAIFSFIGVVFFAVASLVTLIAGGPINYSFARIYLRLVGPENRRPKIEDLVEGFVGNNFLRTLVAQLEITVFTFLWSLLFIIPGIIKTISYSQTFYILADNPKMDADTAIKRSMEMMDGHKMDYFMLVLSFIPWVLLCIITLGIATIYVGPYMSATFAEFYRNVKTTSKLEAVVEKAVEIKETIKHMK